MPGNANDRLTNTPVQRLSLHASGASIAKRAVASAGAFSVEDLTLRRAGTFADAEDAWRALQSQAWMSPYQTYDWLEVWSRRNGQNEFSGHEPLLVCGDLDGETVIILPMCLRRQGGAVVCRWLGGAHINYCMPIVRRDVIGRLDADGVKRLLELVSDLVDGIDLFDFINQPQIWRAQVNPFALLPGRESPSRSFQVTLNTDFDAFFRDRRSRKARHALARKERRLTETYGPVALKTAQTCDEVKEVLAVFFRQRASRFREMGVGSLFDRPGQRHLVTELADKSIETGVAHLRLDYLKAGDSILAIYGGSVHDGRYSSFFNSFSTAHAAYSPGDILLAKVFRKCCEEGGRDFDLGIGEGRYKEAWCDPDPLFDCVFALTMAGRIAAIGAVVPRLIKRTIKNNALLWPAAKSIRRIVVWAEARAG